MDHNTKQQEVYCLVCRKLVEASKAVHIMKTGFYFLVYPMAVNCVECAPINAKIIR